jgi:hypothetical protein
MGPKMLGERPEHHMLYAVYLCLPETMALVWTSFKLGTFVANVNMLMEAEDVAIGKAH